MGWLLPIALQLAQASGAPPVAAPYPYAYPYPPPYAQAQAYPPEPTPGYPLPPPALVVKAPPPPPTPVNFYARVTFAWGPTSFFSPETRALRQLGFRGLKVQGQVDGAWFLSQRVGVGAFGVYSSLTDSGELGTLRETLFVAGAQAPVRFGTRDLSALLTPRVGFATGEIAITRPGASDPPNQQTVALGADFALVSFSAHLGGSIGLVYAGVGAPGGLGRTHDFGSLYFSVGGLIDG